MASNLQGSGEQPVLGSSSDFVTKLEVEDQKTLDKLKVEEYKALRAQIAANTEKMYTITQYVLLLSAIVYAFLLGFVPEHVPANTANEFTAMPFLLKKIVWSMPTVVSCFGGLLLLGMFHSL